MSLLDISYVMFARIKPHMHSGDDGFSFDDVLGYILVCIVFSAIAWVINKAKNAELEWRKRRKEKKFAKHAVRTVGESKKVSSIWYNQALNENNQTAMKNACNNDNAPMRNIMFCPNCGTSVKADYKFCFKCGMELPRINETVIEDRTLPCQNQLRQIKNNAKYSTASKLSMHKEDFLLWDFLWGSKEYSISKCIWMVVLGAVISSVGYVLLDYSKVLDLQRGMEELKWVEFSIGYVIHIIGMAFVTRYAILLLSKVKSGVYEPRNYGKRIKAYIVCVIFLVGWIMGKSSIYDWLEIDNPSFSVWECIIICAILRTVWRTIMGVKDCKKSVLRERLEYAVLSIFLLCGLLLPIISGVANSSKIDSHKVSYGENKRTSKTNSQENISKTNYAVKYKQLSTEKFIGHCKNNRFINASRLIHSVDKDNVWVQFYLGDMYYAGYGVEKNLAKAYLLYRKAAKSGCVEAYTRLEPTRWDKQECSLYYLLSDTTLEKVASIGNKSDKFFESLSDEELEAIVAMSSLEQIKKGGCSSEHRKSLQREYDKYKDALQRCIKNNEVSLPLKR